MRGKAAKILKELEASGITPAYAGKSSAFIRSSPVNQDHPRLCGEKTNAETTKCAAGGSPPPMRGKGVAADTMIDVTRITPAYAGKRKRLSHDVNVQKDHPRLCGEKAKRSRTITA